MLTNYIPNFTFLGKKIKQVMATSGGSWITHLDNTLTLYLF